MNLKNLNVIHLEPKDPDRYQLPVFRCSTCGEIFEQSFLGHCPQCAHHYPAGERCHYCHNHTLRKTMVRINGMTLGKYIKALRNITL